MLIRLYEFERRDRTIYDSIHEYCFAEKVNEEQLRASLNKKECSKRWIRKIWQERDISFNNCFRIWLKSEMRLLMMRISKTY
jgi:hypothetical protein